MQVAKQRVVVQHLGFLAGCQPEKQVQCCLPAYLLVTSRLLVLLGGLNLFTEERLRYFHMSLFLLCSTCVTYKWETQYSLRYWAEGEKKLLQVWLKELFQILLKSEKMKSVFLVTVLTKCYNTQDISRGKNR